LKGQIIEFRKLLFEILTFYVSLIHRKTQSERIISMYSNERKRNVMKKVINDKKQLIYQFFNSIKF